MSSLNPTIHCLCEESDVEVSVTYDEAPKGEVRFPFVGTYNRDYRRCKICGHFYSSHSMDMSTLYDRDYLTATYGGEDGVLNAFNKIIALPVSQSDNHQRICRIQEFVIRKFGNKVSEPKLLDVGSGLAVFVYGMEAQGWQCTALDPDKRFSLHASNVTGAETITGDFLNTDGSDWKTFHCVSFNKVLEHVEDPIAFLTKAGRILKTRGFIYLEVPDGETAILEGQNREEFFIDHHHVFSAASLVFMITNAGLTLVRLERLQEPSGKFTFVAFAVPKL